MFIYKTKSHGGSQASGPSLKNYRGPQSFCSCLKKKYKKQTPSSFVFTAFAKQRIIGIFFPETNQQAKLALALFLCRSLVKMEIEFSLGASAFDQLYSFRLRSRKNSSFLITTTFVSAVGKSDFS